MCSSSAGVFLLTRSSACKHTPETRGRFFLCVIVHSLSAEGLEAVIKAAVVVVVVEGRKGGREEKGGRHGFGASAFPVTMTGCFFCSS